MPLPEFFTMADLQAEEEFQATLRPNNPLHKSMCSIDEDGQHANVYWGGYEYHIEMSRITKPEQILGWVAHLGAKTWPYSTPYRMTLFIRMMCVAKEWDVLRV